MKVKELIDILKTCDPESIVFSSGNIPDGSTKLFSRGVHVIEEKFREVDSSMHKNNFVIDSKRGGCEVKDEEIKGVRFI